MKIECKVLQEKDWRKREKRVEGKEREKKERGKERHAATRGLTTVYVNISNNIPNVSSSHKSVETRGRDVSRPRYVHNCDDTANRRASIHLRRSSRAENEK